MHRTKFFTITFFTIFSLSFAHQAENPLYSIAAPNTIRPNTPYHLLVTIHDAPSPVQVKVELGNSKAKQANVQDKDKGNVAEPLFASESLESGETKLIQLNIGDWGHGSYYVNVIGSGGITFNKSVDLNFKAKTFSVFIQTDKAIYKPGQIVHFRILAVDVALKPLDTDDASVYIEDSRRNRIKQWNNLTFTNGVISEDLQLSDQVVLGDWKIHVRVKHDKSEKQFTVNEYILPTFEVNIQPPPYVVYNSPKHVITVVAKYTYGKPVKGQLFLNVSDAYCKYPCTSRYVKSFNVTTSIDGKADVNIDFVEDLNLPNWMQHGNRLAISASVVEDLTGQSQSGTAEVKIYKTDYELHFTKSDTFKPGLPYTISLAATLQDGRPIMNPVQNVTFKCFNGNSLLKIIEADIPTGGEIVMDFVAPEDSASIRCEAITNETNAYAYLQRARSLSNKYIELSISNPNVKIGDEVLINVKSTTEMNDHLLFSVIGRGKILHYAKVKPSNSKSHSLTLQVTADMVPKVRVVAYYTTFCGEVIADAVDFAIDGVFKTEVDVQVKPDSTKPGTSVDVTISTSPNAFIGLLAVDQSVLLLKSGNDITISQVLDDLQGYEIGERSYYTYDRRKRSSYYMRPWRPSSITTLKMFSNVGLIFMTNGMLVQDENEYYSRAEYDSYPQSLASPSRGGAGGRQPFVEPERIRSFFPETFLWLNGTSGTNGTLTIQTPAPDTITTYFITAFALDKANGLGLTKSPTKLHVFQPFFVSLNLPYSVIRGETLAMQAIVFNYLDKDIEAHVTLDNEEGNFVFVELENTVELDSPQEKQMTKIINVKSGEGVSVSFLISSKKLGYNDIKVTVKSALAADAILRKLLVKAEGTTHYFSSGLLIDLKDEKEFKEKVTIDIPKDIVPDSEHVEVSAISDIMGSTVTNLNKLIRMPYGCGEQNMVNFVPNIVILEYLTKTNRLTPEIREKAIRFTESGYQRQLTYKRSDNSFSVFGQSDRVGSTWLTAFVVKSFLQAKAYITIDNKVITNSLNWLARQQAENGTFQEYGSIWSKSLQGGSGQGIGFTAYVLSAFLESTLPDHKGRLGQYRHNIDNRFLNLTTDSIVRKSLAYLEDELQYITSDYDLILTTYVLTLAGSDAKDAAFAKMNEKVKSDLGFMHWSMPQLEIAPTKHYYRRPASVDVEMTAYALLTYMLRGQFKEAFPIMRWLVSKRNEAGGFESTQDTVMAIQALAKFAGTLSSSDETNLHVTITYGDEKKTDLHLTTENALLLHRAQLPQTVREVDVSATGSGVGIVQVTWSYNVLTVNQQPAFTITANATGDDNSLSVQTCVSYSYEEETESNMAVIEIGIPSGYTIDKNALPQLSKKALPQFDRSGLPQLKGIGEIKRVDTKNGDTVMIIYLDSVGTEVCAEAKAHRTFKVAEAKPAMIEVYDYYDPHKRAEIFYDAPVTLSVCDLCETEDCKKKENCD